MDTILRDVRYAARILFKSPSFTVTVLLTLALGIGANTTIFSVMSATLLKRLPFPQPEKLVLLWKSFGPDDLNIVSASNFWDWKQNSQAFTNVALFDSAGKGYNVGTGERDSEQVSGLRVTADFFNVLGTPPLFGRGFLPEEETLGRDREVVLSYGLWQRRFGGDPALLHKEILVDGAKYTVVGIMPREFQFQFWSDSRELWVPVGWTTNDRSRGSNSFVAIGRLKPGVSLAQANLELRTIQERLAKEYVEEERSSATVVPMSSYGLEGVRRITIALLASVGFVLLIGCINVANLMLARGAGRRKEFAIRRAIGASDSRVVRQLLIESALLALMGGVAGTLLAVWASALLTHILPPDFAILPFRPLSSVTLDVPVLCFTLLISTLTGILCGIAPGLTAVRGELNDPLKEGGRTSHSGHNRFRNILVACEVGLALVMLSSAGLMIKTMARLIAVDPGFNPKNVLTMHVSVPQENTYVGPPTHAHFCQQLNEELGAISGVQSVSAAAHLPMRGDAGRSFHIGGRELPPAAEKPSGHYTVICPKYFSTLGIPLLKGREFTNEDTLESSAVAIINQAMAQRYWPNEDPVGKRISLDARDPKEPWMTVVGVAGNVHHWGLDNSAKPQFFRVYTQAGWPTMQVVVRTNLSSAAFMAAARPALSRIEPTSTPVLGRTMEETVRGSLGSRRFPMILLAAFSGLALVLAGVGILGVVSYSVAQRTHELGVRIALGAEARHILGLVLGGNLRWVLLGIAGGAIGSTLAARLLSTLLYQVEPNDPAILSIVAAILIAVAVASSYAPAQRATRVDPIAALRRE